MEPTVMILQSEYDRLRGIEESYEALQKAYETLHLRVVAEAVRPPVIEPSEAEKIKRELSQVLDTNSRLVIQNDIFRNMLRSLMDAL